MTGIRQSPNAAVFLEKKNVLRYSRWHKWNMYVTAMRIYRTSNCIGRRVGTATFIGFIRPAYKTAICTFAIRSSIFFHGFPRVFKPCRLSLADEGSVNYNILCFYFFFLKKTYLQAKIEAANVESWPRLVHESVHCIPRFPSSYPPYIHTTVGP